MSFVLSHITRSTTKNRWAIELNSHSYRTTHNFCDPRALTTKNHTLMIGTELHGKLAEIIYSKYCDHHTKLMRYNATSHLKGEEEIHPRFDIVHNGRASKIFSISCHKIPNSRQISHCKPYTLLKLIKILPSSVSIPAIIASKQ